MQVVIVIVVVVVVVVVVVMVTLPLISLNEVCMYVCMYVNSLCITFQGCGQGVVLRDIIASTSKKKISGSKNSQCKAQPAMPA